MSFGRICSRRSPRRQEQVRRKVRPAAQRGEVSHSCFPLRVEDLRAVFSVLVVLGKVFKQANPSLIPL
jgi:hypothetical protein